MIYVGIVGLGGMGTVHFHNYQHIRGCKVKAAVVNTEVGREKAKEFGLKAYPTIKAMVEDEEIDVVDVCTPTYLHKEHVEEALTYKKHVFVEKPIALRKQDAEEMYALAEQKQCQLFVGQVLQFTKETEILRKFVRTEKLGRPLDGYFWRLSSAPKWSAGGWLFDRGKSGLIPFDLHIHDLDLIINLFGKPDSYTFTSCRREGMDYEDAYRFQYKYENLNVLAEAAWYNANIPFRAGWRIYFENGLVETSEGHISVYPAEGKEEIIEVKEDVLIPTGINLPPTGMFYRELSHFIHCIQKGVPTDRVPKDQVLAAIEILEKLNK